MSTNINNVGIWPVSQAISLLSLFRRRFVLLSVSARADTVSMKLGDQIFANSIITEKKTTDFFFRCCCSRRETKNQTVVHHPLSYGSVVLIGTTFFIRHRTELSLFFFCSIPLFTELHLSCETMNHAISSKSNNNCLIYHYDLSLASQDQKHITQFTDYAFLCE